MNINIDQQTQLTLSLATRTGTQCRQHPRHRRLRRAALWFSHMRQVVEQAHDWLPAPIPSNETQHTKSE